MAFNKKKKNSGVISAMLDAAKQHGGQTGIKKHLTNKQGELFLVGGPD